MMMKIIKKIRNGNLLRIDFKRVFFAGLIFIACFVFAPNALAATRTISDAGGNWNSTGSWVEGAVPTTGDDVVATATSGNLVVNVATAVLGSFNLTGYVGTLSGASALNVSGNVTLASGMTLSTTGGLVISGTSTLTTNGKIFATASASLGLKIDGASASVTLGDALSINCLIFVKRGTFNTANYNITFGGTYPIFGDENSSTAKTINLGSSSITGIRQIAFTGSGALTVSSNTAHLQTAVPSNAYTHTFGSTSGWHNVEILLSTVSTRLATISGTNTFEELTITGSDGTSCIAAFSDNQTVTSTLTLTKGGGGDQTDRPLIRSSVIGTQRTLTLTGATVNQTDVDLQDIAYSGSPTINTTRVGNLGGNSSGITSTPKTVYADFGSLSPSWLGSNMWATSSGGGDVSLDNYPLPQDTAVIDDNSFDANSRQITCAGANVSNIDASTLTETQLLRFGSGCSLYGSITAPSNFTVGFTLAYTLTIDARVASTLTLDFTAGGTAGNFNIDSYGGTVQLESGITAVTVTLTRGTLDLNGQTITCTSFSSSNTNTRELKDTAVAGGGKIVLNALTGTALDFSTDTNLTVSNAPDIDIGDSNNTLTADVTFAGGGKTFGDFSVKKHAGDYDCLITGANTFGAVALETPDATYSYSDLQITAGTTQTMSSFSAVGTASYPINILSTGSAFTLSDPSGTNAVSYCNISNSTAAGGALWTALLTDGNVRGEGNSGWIFGLIEFISIVDSGNGTSTDYTSLSAWETGVQTDLATTTTQVFSGTLAGSLSDNSTVYLCRGTSYQSHSGILVHTTSGQILIESITGSATETTADFWNSSSTCTSPTNYFTISDGGDSAIAVAKCRTSSGAADTTAVTIDGWTTSATNYIKVWTDPAENYRHMGKWDETKYRLENELMSRENYVRMDGLQVKRISSTGSFARGIYVSADLDPTNEIIISNNIVRGVFTGSGDHSYGIIVYDLDAITKVYNNIVYGWRTSATSYVAGFLIGGTAYVYNNTSYGNYIGFFKESTLADTFIKNNLAYDNVDNYAVNGSWNAASTNNLSGPGADTDIPATGKRDGVTVSFVNTNAGDFHLVSDDTGAKNYGADLAADTNLAITNDIDGSTRPTGSNIVDIGADEAATEIYYSAGQNTTTHETGAGNVTVDATARTAAFTVPQTATNMGVGDLIDYDTDNKKCFITEKVSTSVWKCQSATGTAPMAATGAAVNSIAHAYASLNAAEAGAVNSSHLNTTNLVTGNYVLNIPTYYDSGPDQTAVTVEGYTTGHHNYIKIYTPYNTLTEVNQSQRHNGKWDDAKYALSLGNSGANQAIYVNNNDVWIDGIQILRTVDSGLGRGIFTGTVTGINVSNCIIKASLSGTVTQGVGIYYYRASGQIWNNIVYGFINGSDSHQGIALQGGTIYAYNNTTYGNYQGILKESAFVNVLKNNISYNNTDNYNGTFDASSANNLSGPGTDAQIPATNKRDGVTVFFIDVINKDFHLTSTDTGAKGYGANLSNDTYLAFSDDIDSQERTGNWSIGADEPRESEVQSSDQKVQSLTDGLVLYQSFDGEHLDWASTTAEARDQSGSENHGDVSGAVVAIGKKGQALSFDGTDDYVNAGAPSNIRSITEFTIGAWIYPESFGGGSKGRIAAKWASNAGFYFEVDNSNCASGLSIGINSGTAGTLFKCVANSIALNKWQYATVTMDSSKFVTLYVDGVSVGTLLMTAFPTMNTATSLLIGADPGTALRLFDGNIDETRVYNRALSADEVGNLYRLGGIKTNMSLTDKNTNGLVGMWSFDGADISGATAYDRSPVGTNHGTISGAVPVMGKKGQALSLNGTSDYISIGDSASLLDLPNTALSFAAWLKVKNDGSNGYLFFKSTGSDTNGWGFSLDEFRRARFSARRETTTLYVVTDANKMPVYANGWFHIAVTYPGGDDASNVHIYVNGSEVSGYSIQTNGEGSYMSDSGLTARIGRSGYNLYANANFDEVRVYDRALSADEVGDLYRLGQVEIRR